jgi:hypothetical protein
MSNETYYKFVECCKAGLLAKAQFLYGTGEVELNEFTSDILFRCCCRCGHLEFAKWLYSLGNIDVRSSNDQAICFAYDKGHLDIVKWLCSVCEDYEYLEDEKDYQIVHKTESFVKIYSSKIVDECGECIICYENEANIQTICGHFYCRDCFGKSLEKIEHYKDFNCAYCRQKLNLPKKNEVGPIKFLDA